MRIFPVKITRAQRASDSKGELDDKGHIYRCWNCGFIIDNRRVRGTSGHVIWVKADDDWVGTDVNIEEYYRQGVFGLLIKDENNDLMSNPVETDDIFFELDENGDIEMKCGYYSLTDGDCPFCGAIF